MSLRPEPRRSVVADSIYGLLNPIPFGCFVAALIFDIIYSETAVMLWDKAAAWLIVFGLLVRRGTSAGQPDSGVGHIPANRDPRGQAGLLVESPVAIVVAIFNAFVHSRDAYAVVPTGLWLSAFTVLVISIGNIVVSVHRATRGGICQ
jgi:uncharacterized membrane protein